MQNSDDNDLPDKHFTLELPGTEREREIEHAQWLQFQQLHITAAILKAQIAGHNKRAFHLAKEMEALDDGLNVFKRVQELKKKQREEDLQRCKPRTPASPFPATCLSDI